MQKIEPSAPATASTGFWGVEPRDAEDGTPDINFRFLKADPPEDQRMLKGEAERALSIVKALYHRKGDEPKLREAVAKLLALSQVGLVGPIASPAVAKDALRALEADIVEREAGPIKNAYMRKLGLWALAFGAAGMVAYLACEHHPSIFYDEFHRIVRSPSSGPARWLARGPRSRAGRSRSDLLTSSPWRTTASSRSCA